MLHILWNWYSIQKKKMQWTPVSKRFLTVGEHSFYFSIKFVWEHYTLWVRIFLVWINEINFINFAPWRNWSLTYGESICKGESEEFRICELEDCLVPVDLRSQQCSRLQTLISFEEKLLNFDSTWLPYEPDKEDLKCQLVCRNKETDGIYYSKLNLIDGTPCSYGSSDICVQVI